MNDLQLMYMINGNLATVTASEIVDMIGFPRASDDPQAIKFSLAEAPVGGTALSFTVQHSPTLDFSTPIVAYTSQPISMSGVGIEMILEIPVPTMQRYSRVLVNKTGTFTAGKLNIYIGLPEEFGWDQLESKQRI